jgi:hypothetical protein
MAEHGNQQRGSNRLSHPRDPVDETTGSAIAGATGSGVFPDGLWDTLWNTGTVAAPVQDAMAAGAAGHYRQIVFIEGDVGDAHALAAGVAPGVLAVILDPNADGLQQIAAFLTSHDVTGLSAIDIVTHGADGEIALGSATLSAATVAGYQSDLATIGSALQAGGAIQLFGCDVAQDEAGTAFLQQISAAAGGANVAAASHLVGAAAQGGDWTLNVDVGTVDVASPFTASVLSAYPDLLAISNDRIIFDGWNGETNNAISGNRVEQISVNGASFVAGSTVDIGDASQSIDNYTTRLPSGLVADTALNEYFLADDPGPTGTQQQSIIRNTITGASSVTTLYTSPYRSFTGNATGYSGNYSSIDGLALDAPSSQLYFTQDATDNNGNTITSATGVYRMSINGGTPTLITNDSANVLVNPANLVLDISANLVFFLDSIPNLLNVSYLDVANLSTGAITQLETFASPTNFFFLSGLAIDTVNDKLYVTTVDESPANAANNENAIISLSFSTSGSGSTANASITSVSTLYHGSGAFQPTDIVIDPAQGILYTSGLDGSGTGGIFEGSLSGGASLTEVESMSSVAGSTAGSVSKIEQLAVLTTPVVTASGTVTAISGGTTVAVDSGLTIADQDGQLLVSATVSGALTGDTLSFNGGTSKTFTDGYVISSSFNSTTGVLTLNGNASVADYQAALDAVTFKTTSTSATARTIGWTVSESGATSGTANSTVAVHTAPTVTAGASVSFTGGGAAVTLDAGLAVADTSSTTLSGATIIIANAISGDVLNFSAQNNIGATYANGVLTLSGNASLANYQTALESITYSFTPSNGDPTGGGSHTSRTIDWTVNDGVVSSSTATSALTLVHAAPTVTAGATASFTGGSSASTVLDAGLTLSDPDSGNILSGATVSIGGFVIGDELNFDNQNKINGVYNSATGTLVLSGAASLGNYQTALASITYNVSLTNGDPTGGGSHTSRTINWTVNDGVSSVGATSTLDTVHVAGTITTGGTVTYTGTPVALDASVGLVDVDSAGNLVGATVTIGNFQSGDTLQFANQDNITGSFNNGTLSLSGTATLAAYQTALESVAYATTSASLAERTINWAINDGASTSGASTSAVDVICFRADTMIGTPHGEVPVQTLQPGDIVLTVGNGPRAVKWVGHGKVLAARGRRSAATPVIVSKGALADNVPNRDLHVTKAHSLYIDDVLIPVEFLVNHKTIRWDDRAQEVEIYHIELDSHDLLLANGAPAESYRDDGNRWLFQNANAGWDGARQEPCAPVLTGGPLVDAVWRRLLDRAGPRCLPPLTDDPDLHLLVDGVRVGAHHQDGSAYLFRLYHRPGRVILASRSAVPAELGFARDSRPLGVGLRWVTIRQGSRAIRLGADDDRLNTGFHGYEPAEHLRWTDGSAELPAELFAGFATGAEVMLQLDGAMRYLDEAGDQMAA